MDPFNVMPREILLIWARISYMSERVGGRLNQARRLGIVRTHFFLVSLLLGTHFFVVSLLLGIICRDTTR